jgi:hypothetical protein
MRAFWKALSIALVVMLLGCGLLSLSMYAWPTIPSSPRPAEGRTYPLNNHGHYTYMNRSEYLVRETIQLIWIPLIFGFGAIQYFLDPFGERRRRRLYGSAPRGFR